ncbi:MAG: mechanosensitive ion channel, partial [Thioalkalivibrio sp.]|nr:mechanosensitive ion channel [Thioalkalivibrio sp.]
RVETAWHEMRERETMPTVRGRVEDATDWLLEASLSRLEEIYARASQERLKYDEFEDGLQASVSRAFVQDLERLVFDYMSGLGALLVVREQLGLNVENEWNTFEEFVIRNVERLHGQIRLDAQTLSELRRSLSADPSNAGVESALRAVDQKQARNLANMAGWLELLKGLGIDTASHRALLIQQHGRIGTEILQRDVFANVWSEQTQRLWRNVARNGPNLALRVLTFLAVLLLAWVVAHAIRFLLKAIIDTSFVRISQLMEDRLLTLSFGLIFLAGVIVALTTMGWSVMPMLAGLGVAGLVVGFALQDSLKSFVAGWMILLYHAYDVGDYVQVSGAEGRVRRMTLNSTRIATRDNTIKLVPNRKIWDDTIVNLTASKARRVELEIACGPDNDMDRVESSIRELLAEHPQILNKPKPEVHLARIGPSEMIFLVQPWVRTENYWPIQRSLLKEVRQRFARDGIA